MIDVLLLCKPGFERDAAEEWLSLIRPISCGELLEAPEPSRPLYVERSGFLEAQITPPLLAKVEPALRSGLIFVTDAYPVVWRQVAKATPSQASIDRTLPIAEAIRVLATAQERAQLPCGALRVLCPEASAVAGLERFCSSFTHPLRNVLLQQGILSRGPAADGLREPVEAIVVFVSYERFAVTLRLVKDGERARRRGRVARGGMAPSRSGSKLAEADRYFSLGMAADRSGKLGIMDPRRRAIDLGAAPGGWTAWLVAQGYSVVAVDNGALDPKLVEQFGDRIEHRRADAFHLPVDPKAAIVVCDVVDRPEKVIELMLRWAVRSAAETMVFNLKLPMKRRFEEIARCLERLRSGLDEALQGFQCQAHQLYHDRQEVTVVVRDIVR